MDWKMAAFRPHSRVQTDCGGISRTKQSFADECNINKIIAKFRKTGMITHLKATGGQYGDFTGVTDYRAALDAIREADASFATLPADIRRQFDNDPGQFLQFVSNPDNREALVDMGLVAKTPSEPHTPEGARPPVPEAPGDPDPPPTPSEPSEK